MSEAFKLAETEVQTETETLMTGAQMMIETLERLGVKTMFGYPGGAVLNIYDALYHSDIDHVLTRHEQAAIHAAEGFARATGKVGVVLATSGPGATNLVTGITDAYMDSTPLVIFTGQVPVSMIGRDAFQEADVIGITMPITKHSYQVRDAKDIPRIIVEAFTIAASGRPGPVLIDIPKDISGVKAEFKMPDRVHLRGYQPTIEPSPIQITRVVEAISKAKKPLLYIGGGVISAEAAEQVRQLAEMTQIPVTSTLMGLGAFPYDHPLFVGMLGMHGTYAANRAVFECDLLIACGVRFDDRVTGKLERFSPNSKKVHIDIDPAEIGKNVPIDYPIVADVKRTLEVLIERKPTTSTQPWVEQLQALVQEYPLSYAHEEEILRPQYVIDLINDMTQGKAVVTTEVGQHQMWAAHFYKAAQPRSFITSGGLGTMGYGFPAAMGAKIARPDDMVICIAGDASLQMNIQEMQTVVERDIRIIIVVINNGYAGMVRQWQELFYENRISESRISSPDFVKVAEAFGIRGLRAKTPEEARTILQEAFTHNGPILLDFTVAEGENVFPMVPPGKGNDEMIIGGWEE